MKKRIGEFVFGFCVALAFAVSFFVLSCGVVSAADCPPEMANIDGKYCIDRWEAIVIDKNSGQVASAYYNPVITTGFQSATAYYARYKNKPCNIPIPEVPEFQTKSEYVPVAVSRQGEFPQGFMNRPSAKTACENAGKRLCTRQEWYNACVGPEAPKWNGKGWPSRYFPWGPTTSKSDHGKCNIMFYPASAWSTVKGSDNVNMGQPQLGLAEYDGNRLLAKTGQFEQCTNSYGVFDMWGNQDEIVSDNGASPNNMLFVGEFYARGRKTSGGCAEGIGGHADAYYDYSIGFRCCAEIGAQTFSGPGDVVVPPSTGTPSPGAPSAPSEVLEGECPPGFVAKAPAPVTPPRPAVPSGPTVPASTSGAGPSSMTPSGGAVEVVPGTGGCPDGMVSVNNNLCIDMFEASLVKADGSELPYHTHPPNDMAGIKARSVKGVKPQGQISGVQAEKACENAGKRLCSMDEWMAACTGGDASRTYPYGAAKQDRTCNDDVLSKDALSQVFGPSHGYSGAELADPRVLQSPNTLLPAGGLSGCVSPVGAFDMVGNLHEWISTKVPPGNYNSRWTKAGNGIFKGGYFRDTYRNGWGCNYKTTAHGFSHWDYSTGFRCCMDKGASSSVSSSPSTPAPVPGVIPPSVGVPPAVGLAVLGSSVSSSVSGFVGVGSDSGVYAGNLITGRIGEGSSGSVVCPAGTIGIVGDSITVGSGGGNNYPEMLGKLLKDACPDAKIVFEDGNPETGQRMADRNAGRRLNDKYAFGGKATPQMKRDFDAVLAGGHSDIIMMGGINDLSGSLPTDGIKANLLDMYTRAEARGIRVIALTTTPWMKFNDRTFGWSEAKYAEQVKLNDWIKSKPGGVDVVIDLYPVLGDAAEPRALKKETKTFDGLHPSTPGLQMIADAVFRGAYTSEGIAGQSAASSAPAASGSGSGEFACPDKSVACVGDSITVGGGGRSNYPAMLEDLLKARCPSAKVVKEDSDPGTTSKINGGDKYAVIGKVTSTMKADFGAVLAGEHSYVFIMGGINDLAGSASADRIKGNLAEMYSQAKARGVKVVAITSTPWKGYAGGYGWTDAKFAEQKKLNEWILSKPENVDFVVDSYSALNDPSNLDALKKEFDSGDHLHPNPAGLKVIAQAAFDAVYSSSASSPSSASSSAVGGPTMYCVDVPLDYSGVGAVGGGSSGPYCPSGSVAVVGDSMTVGGGGRNSYPGMIEDLLKPNCPSVKFQNEDSDPATLSRSSSGGSPSPGPRDKYAFVGKFTGQMKSDFDSVLSGNHAEVVILGGGNDLASGASAESIEANLADMYSRAKVKGLRVVAVTTTPWKGYPAWSEAKAAEQKKLNAWILGKPANVDAVVDIYSVLDDPSNPDALKPETGTVDKIHPGLPGFKMVAETIFKVAFSGGAAVAGPVVVASTGGAGSGGGCANKRIGLVGASNTVDQDPMGNSFPPDSSNVNILKELCPGATVFLHAKGGTGPGQQVQLVEELLKNDGLEYVILDTSANSQQVLTPEQYKEAAIKLAQMVKAKDSSIKVVMLTNTPLKGATDGTTVFGTDRVVQNVKAYNEDLLKNKLGRPELIDFVVDTYSATEDPSGSDACGKYCTRLGDKIHFGALGRRAVMDAIVKAVFTGSASGTVRRCTPLPGSVSKVKVVCVPAVIPSVFDFIIYSQSGITNVLGISRQNLAVGITRDEKSAAAALAAALPPAQSTPSAAPAPSTPSTPSAPSGGGAVPVSSVSVAPGQCAVQSPTIPYTFERYSQIYGNPRGAGVPTTTITFKGKRVAVHSKIKDVFPCVEAELESCPEGKAYEIRLIGALHCREIRGAEGTGRMSMHCFATAIDFNWDKNPLKDDGVLVTDMPKCFVDAFKKYGFTWGGDWGRRKDAMHFEFHGDPALIGGSSGGASPAVVA